MSHSFPEPQAASRLDKFCLYTGAAFPFALISGNTAFEAVVALVGLCWLTGLIVERRNPFPDLVKDPIVLPWIAWYGSIVLSLLFNGPGNKGWGHDIAFIRQLLFMTALLDISRRTPVAKPLAIGLAIGTIWAGLNLSVAYLFGHDLMGNALLKHQSKVFLTGRIAAVASYTGPLFCCFALLRKKELPKTRVLALVIGLISFFLVIHSNVRAVTIASLLGFTSCLVWQVSKRFSRKILISTGIGLVLILGIAIHNIQISQVGKVVNLASMYDRVKVWQVSAAIWQDSPFLGIGVSSFRETYKEKAATFPEKYVVMPDGTSFGWHKSTTHAHNTILMLLVCTGIPGLLTFLWLFIRLVTNSIRIQGQHPETIALLTVFITIGLVGFNIYHSWYISLFVYLVAMAGILFRRSNTPD